MGAKGTGRVENLEGRITSLLMFSRYFVKIMYWSLKIKINGEVLRAWEQLSPSKSSEPTLYKMSIDHPIDVLLGLNEDFFF